MHARFSIYYRGFMAALFVVTHCCCCYQYDNQRESGTGPTIRNIRHSERQGTPPRQSQNQDLSQRIIGTELNKSPHEILETIGSMETVRIRNVKNLLSDFFSF